MAVTSWIQNSFKQLNRQLDPTALPVGQYALLTNGRVRNGGVEPILLPKQLTGADLAQFQNIQGIYGTDTFLLVFADGQAFYRNYNIGNTIFYKVPGFLMNPQADWIYVQVVPASTVNYQRTATTDTDGVVLPAQPVIFLTPINGSPACILCQDGTSQPFVILPDGSCRQTQNYAQWSNSVSSGTLTFIIQPNNGDTVVIGTQVYTFLSVFVNAPGNVLIGTDLATTLTYLQQAINNGPAGAGSGANYGSGTPQNTQVYAISNATTLVVNSTVYNQSIAPFEYNGSTNGSWNVTQLLANGIAEYVPIGTLMCYINNKLYLLMKDTAGNYTQIASSISGRPLDFMSIIDVNGNKLATEAQGGALNLAYSLDYTPVTCMSTVGSGSSANGQGNTFFVSTRRTSYIVSPNYNTTFFGEPTYTNQPLFSAGALNQFSVTDILGDIALVDSSGMRSFNAILTTKFEGRNAPFSATLQRLFGTSNANTIIQNASAAYTWDNYGFFAVQTIYGPAVLIYDTNLQNWVAVDLYPGIAQIKQFADIKTTTSFIAMFFITTDNKIYQFGASSIVATVGMYIGEFAPNTIQSAAQGALIGNDVKPQYLNLTFVNVGTNGTVNIEAFMDNQNVGDYDEAITETGSITTLPVSLPFGDSTDDQVRNVTIDLNTLSPGWKIGFWITWNFSAQLLQASFTGEIQIQPTSLKEQARDFVALKSLLTSNTALIPMQVDNI